MSQVTEKTEQHGFVRALGMFDSTMIVIGTMIGSGIFIVSADMSRTVGSAGWLLAAWFLSALLTMGAAISYGELASMMPEAGGMYVYLREAFSPIVGFLYGWTLYTVIQTGTIAAVAVGFARFSGILFPAVSESNYLIAPILIGSSYAISLSTAQLTAIVVIAVLTWTNSQGIHYGKIIQNLFTVAKLGGLFGLIVAGFTVGRNPVAIDANFRHLWDQVNLAPVAAGLTAATTFGLFIALCVSQVGSLFAADSWHDITFAAAEVKDPKRTLPRSLVLGCAIVMGIYLLANVAYLLVLPITAIQNAPSDRVATAMLEAIWPGWGSGIMAVVIMISAFGCVNSLVLAGPRVYYAMAQDGLFLKSAAKLNGNGVPGRSLLIQGLWSAALVLPRTFDTATGKYGNLYSNLLDWVISAALLFYILTIAGVMRLRTTRPNVERPYKTWGYPVVPILYIIGSVTILATLFVYRGPTTWPGLVIVMIGLPVYAYMKRK